MKTRAVGAELFHAEGRTDMTKLMVAFRNYQSAPVYQCNIISLVGDTQYDSWHSTLSFD
jgi:hypothetical protein